jgi:hypothetical protein
MSDKISKTLVNRPMTQSGLAFPVRTAPLRVRPRRPR